MQGRQRGRDRARTWGGPTGRKAETQSGPGVSYQVRRSQTAPIPCPSVMSGASEDTEHQKGYQVGTMTGSGSSTFFFFFEGVGGEGQRESEAGSPPSAEPHMGPHPTTLRS